MNPRRLVHFIVLSAFVLRLQAAEPYPLAPIVAAAKANCAKADFTPTHLKRDDYLQVVEGIVLFFQKHQDAEGRIIDPYAKREIQYSTPCYAWAAAALIASGRQTNLLDSAALALDASLQELADAKAADNHGDFFTFPAMLAYEHLRDRVPKTRREHWELLLRKIEPYRAYRDVLDKPGREPHNWNVVALSGEFLRHKDGFADAAFVEKHLEYQLRWLTPNGQYLDPNVPMAYDLFPRHFLAAILERGYNGPQRARLEELMERGAWTSLLVQSSTGEVPIGGRSAQHQWNEAEQCVLYEIWATRKERAHNSLESSIFKRAAHLSLQSIRRWVRPTGELWIVKNRFDPAKRHGFETYSHHSQYNLLTASMLATAWLFADDNMTERAAPCEVGGFIFSLRDFHKVFANAGGYYLEFDTQPDPHYDSVGLVRLQKAGFEPLLGPSAGGPAAKTPLAIGVAWPVNDAWESLAEMETNEVQQVKLSVTLQEPKHLQFSLFYDLDKVGAESVTENYDLTPQKLNVTILVDTTRNHIRLRYPYLTFDGERYPQVTIKNDTAEISLANQSQRITITDPPNATWRQRNEPVPNRNGLLDVLESDMLGHSVSFSITPQLK